MLNADEQKELIEAAWKSIRHEVCGEVIERDQRQLDRFDMDSALRQAAGAFVTLYKKGALRGCLGIIVSEEPLLETVSGIAGRAATADPRFRPVTEDELGSIQIEISILSPLREISSIEEIQVGTHGLFIHAGMFRGLLLPQVAVTQHWNRIQFLEETCIKAGLPPDQWKHSETRIFVFSAEIIKQRAS
jgi:AmmeMemoRadiSam system protein A